MQLVYLTVFVDYVEFHCTFAARDPVPHYAPHFEHQTQLDPDHRQEVDCAQRLGHTALLGEPPAVLADVVVYPDDD